MNGGGEVSTRLELVWPNKGKFLLMPRDKEGKPVWVEPTHPAASEVRLSTFTDAIGAVNDADPHSDNLMFTGDSLDALRILNDVPEFRRRYRGKVKLVYIDPPFNTGQTFTHYDDWMEHSTWLSFMRDRLLLIKDLLAPDGTLWLHLDNFETHRMRCLLDEVFGTDAYVNTVVWKRTSAKSAAKRGMGTMYDNILVYARGEAASLNQVLLPYDDEAAAATHGMAMTPQVANATGPYPQFPRSSTTRLGPRKSGWTHCSPQATFNCQRPRARRPASSGTSTPPEVWRWATSGLTSTSSTAKARRGSAMTRRSQSSSFSE